MGIYTHSQPLRIMIFGRPGSGKSTFALKLSRLLKLPLYHLDRYFYVHNWVERDYQEFLGAQKAMVAEERWIIDGNSSKSFIIRYERAHFVLYFNYPRWLCYWRILKRLFCKDKAIKDRAEGCRETIRYSLLSYMWSFEQRVSEKIEELKTWYPQVQFIEIRNDQDLYLVEKYFLKKLQPGYKK